jgi:hypothetical protein
VISREVLMRGLSRRSWSEWFPETEEEYRERMERSLKMTGPEKMAEGCRLFEKECEMRKEAIRTQHPDLSDEVVDHAFTGQTEEWRAFEQHGTYVEVQGPWPEKEASE